MVIRTSPLWRLIFSKGCSKYTSPTIFILNYTNYMLIYTYMYIYIYMYVYIYILTSDIIILGDTILCSVIRYLIIYIYTILDILNYINIYYEILGIQYYKCDIRKKYYIYMYYIWYMLYICWIQHVPIHGCIWTYVRWRSGRDLWLRWKQSAHSCVPPGGWLIPLLVAEPAPAGSLAMECLWSSGEDPDNTCHDVSRRPTRP